jgi:hypothetical protein
LEHYFLAEIRSERCVIPPIQFVPAGQCGWQAIFDLNTNTVIAALCSYCGAAGQPNRWGGQHSGFGLLQYPWTIMTENLAGGTGARTIRSRVWGRSGGPPWNDCPANSFGATGPNCSTVSVGSITPLAGGASLFGQTILPGDYVSGDQECMRALTITGTSIVWQRNVLTEISDFRHLRVRTTHPPNIPLIMTPSVIKELWWDWQHDPRATDTTGAYLRTDPHGADCHYGYSVNTMILGCLNFKQPQSIGKPVRLGAMPANLSNPFFSVNFNAPFSTAKAGGPGQFQRKSSEPGTNRGRVIRTGTFHRQSAVHGFGVPSAGVTKVGTYCIGFRPLRCRR